MPAHPNPDREADRISWIIVIFFVTLSLIIEGTTTQMEWARNRIWEPGGIRAQWMFEITSHLAILVSGLIIPFWLARFPISLSNWKRRIPHYVVAFLIFTISHILLMVAARYTIWPFMAEGKYEFGLLSWQPWVYEAQKDFFSFLGFLAVFLTTRQIKALQREYKAAQEEAQSTGRLTLKASGRTLIIPADDIIHAKAAGNYVELSTEAGMHFVRLTLSDLTTLLEQAGAQPVRLHRSHLTLSAHIREIDTHQARLSDGTLIPISRRYKGSLARVAG